MSQTKRPLANEEEEEEEKKEKKLKDEDAENDLLAKIKTMDEDFVYRLDISLPSPVARKAAKTLKLLKPSYEELKSTGAEIPVVWDAVEALEKIVDADFEKRVEQAKLSSFLAKLNEASVLTEDRVLKNAISGLELKDCFGSCPVIPGYENNAQAKEILKTIHKETVEMHRAAVRQSHLFYSTH